MVSTRMRGATMSQGITSHHIISSTIEVGQQPRGIRMGLEQRTSVPSTPVE
jgi:hypothetical protein